MHGGAARWLGGAGLGGALSHEAPVVPCLRRRSQHEVNTAAAHTLTVRGSEFLLSNILILGLFDTQSKIGKVIHYCCVFHNEQPIGK